MAVERLDSQVNNVHFLQYSEVTEEDKPPSGFMGKLKASIKRPSRPREEKKEEEKKEEEKEEVSVSMLERMEVC